MYETHRKGFFVIAKKKTLLHDNYAVIIFVNCYDGLLLYCLLFLNFNLNTFFFFVQDANFGCGPVRTAQYKTSRVYTHTVYLGFKQLT